MQIAIPRIVIAAVSSGSGKTTITAGLLSALRRRGLRVQAYKVGPDYIDPGYHAQASGQPVHNLDTWLVPSEQMQELFFRTAQHADIAIIEGVMGLYDGGRNGISSTAEIAKLLQAPVLLVLDVKSMGASAAAAALGFRSYDPDVSLQGVILNRLGSETHRMMIESALDKLHIPVYGAVRRDDSLKLPERHLGLLPAIENNSEEDTLNRITAAIEKQLDVEKITELARSARRFSGKQTADAVVKPRVCIAVARDEAFSFYYPESLNVLENSGACLSFFSPLHDSQLPEADGIILGGGFPEMFAKELSANHPMLASLRRAAEKGIPIYAECGGFMYLMEQLLDFDGNAYPMAGIIPGKVQMNAKLQMVGYVTAEFLQDTVLGGQGTLLKGHEFHFSSEASVRMDDERAFRLTRMRNQAEYLAGYAKDNILGSYLHLHFAGCPKAAAHFVQKCLAYRKNVPYCLGDGAEG